MDLRCSQGKDITDLYKCERDHVLDAFYRCERRAPDNKFLVTHQEERQDPRYLCMQFLKRSENIVQMKVQLLGLAF